MAGGGMGAAAPTSTGQQSGQPTGFSGVFGDGSTPGTIMQGTGLPPQGGMMGIGGGQLYTGGYGMPMASPAQQAPAGAPRPADFPADLTTATTPTPTGLQFGTAGVGTGIVEAQAPTPQAAPQTMAPFQQQMMMRQQQQYNPYQQQMMRQNPYQQQHYFRLRPFPN